MPLAVTLLAAVAIASVIGTLLQQNQPYQDYILKFGPFWHQVYLSLGLYDVYSSLWFLLLLAFLVASTSLCLVQNGPGILQSGRDFRERLHGKVLAQMPQSRQWRVYGPADALSRQLQQLLKSHGYRSRVETDNSRILIAAKKGSANRLGYICAHLAVVVICIGGLLDGNIPMKWQTLTGGLAIEKRDLPTSQIPDISRIDAGNPSFRANISIPEGAAADFAFINMGGGYVLQKLPFQLRLEQFRIEHYSTGQPRSFESDLILRDPDTGTTIEQTISVNKPLRYRGFNIYQASFEDGGSRLDLQLHPLTAGGTEAATDLNIAARINETVEVSTPDETLRLELEDFRAHNIRQEAASVENQSRFRDNGPSFNFKLRRADGSAREYLNYMYPVTVDGRDYFLSGTRGSPAEEFRYLYLPVDPNGTPRQFLLLLDRLHDESRLPELIEAAAGDASRQLDAANSELPAQISGAMLQVLKLFREGGYGAIGRHIEATVPADERPLAGQAYIKLLHNALQILYRDVLAATGEDEAGVLDEERADFLDAAIEALAAVPGYGAPFFVELNDYEHRQASGLMITRSPGKMLVYPGFVLLLAGVFLLFYIAQRRVWFELRHGDDGRVQLLAAGESNRLHEEFATEFGRLTEQARQLPDSVASGTDNHDDTKNQ